MADELREGPSGPPADVDSTTDDVVNLSDLSPVGGSLTDALDNLSTTGPVSTTIFTNGQVLTAANLPAGNFFIIDFWGSGASGAAGGRTQSALSQIVSGGCPGGGGAHRRLILSRSELLALIASLGGSLPVTVPPASVGPAGRNTNGVGASGVAGSHAAFGPFFAFGGGLGINNSGGEQSAGSGGGTMGPGLPGDTSNGVKAGGAPALSASIPVFPRCLSSARGPATLAGVKPTG